MHSSPLSPTSIYPVVGPTMNPPKTSGGLDSSQFCLYTQQWCIRPPLVLVRYFPRQKWLFVAITGALLTLSGGRAQAAVLGTEDFTASGGVSDIYQAFHPTLAIGPAVTGPGPGASAPATNAPLFQGTSITPQDVGQTITATPDNDPNFNDFVASLTDGNPHKVTLDFGPGLLRNSQFYSTKSGALFGGNSAFSGNTINSISLQINSLTLDTPGTNPNGDGVWTNYSFDGTVIVDGQPTTSDTYGSLTLNKAETHLVGDPPAAAVPEPTEAFGFLAFGFGAFVFFLRQKFNKRNRFLATSK